MDVKQVKARGEAWAALQEEELWTGNMESQ